MVRPNLVAEIRALPLGPRALVVAALLALSVVLGIVFAATQPGADAIAWWWPAAGVNAIIVLSVPRPQLLWAIVAVGAISSVASLSAGRPLLIVILGGVGTALQALIMVWGLYRPGATPRLQTAADAGRLIFTATVASMATGIVVAVGTAVLDGDWVQRFISVTASNLSAILLILPPMLVALAHRRVVPLWQTLLYTAAVLAAVLIAFAPWSSSPLAFLPVPLLAWAAFSLPMLTSVCQVLLAVGLSGLLTAAGWGQFAGHTGLLGTGTLLQIYAIVVAATCLLIAVERSERRRLEQQHEAYGLLLRDSFSRAKSGFAVVQETGSPYWRVVEVNAAAVEMLAPDFAQDARGRWGLNPASKLSARLSAATDTPVMFAGGEDAPDAATRIPSRVTIDPIDNDELGRVVLISVEDLRPVREAERAMQLQLDRERGVSETLRRLTRQQDDFVASVSHELRTPITSIIGYAQELEYDLEDPRLRGYAEVVTRNAERLVGLVDDVLRAARLGAGIVLGPGVQLDLRAVADRVVADLRHIASQRDVRVEVEGSSGAIVHADETELIRVIGNLLTNAFKFSPVGGRVRVEVSIANGEGVIIVADEGPGIADDDRDRVFERFYRSPSAISDGVPGTGIGLAIARELVTAMGGTVRMLPRTPHGTLAELRIPLVAGDEVSAL